MEVLEDVSSGLAPLTYAEAYSMIRSLKSYKIIKGARGKEGINEKKFAEIIVHLSTLLRFATEIKELDLNPLAGYAHDRDRRGRPVPGGMNRIHQSFTFLQPALVIG